jgi:hypothetical protein
MFELRWTFVKETGYFEIELDYHITDFTKVAIGFIKNDTNNDVLFKIEKKDLFDDFFNWIEEDNSTTIDAQDDGSLLLTQQIDAEKVKCSSLAVLVYQVDDAGNYNNTLFDIWSNSEIFSGSCSQCFASTDSGSYCDSSNEANSTVSSFRWKYSRSESKCVEFYYHGCEGNANNYLNAETCYSTCAPEKLDAYKSEMEVFNQKKIAENKFIIENPLIIRENRTYHKYMHDFVSLAFGFNETNDFESIVLNANGSFILNISKEDVSVNCTWPRKSSALLIADLINYSQPKFILDYHDQPDNLSTATIERSGFGTYCDRLKYLNAVCSSYYNKEELKAKLVNSLFVLPFIQIAKEKLNETDLAEFMNTFSVLSLDANETERMIVTEMERTINHKNKTSIYGEMTSERIEHVLEEYIYSQWNESVVNTSVLLEFFESSYQMPIYALCNNDKIFSAFVSLIFRHEFQYPNGSFWSWLEHMVDMTQERFNMRNSANPRRQSESKNHFDDFLAEYETLLFNKSSTINKTELFELIDEFEMNFVRMFRIFERMTEHRHHKFYFKLFNQFSIDHLDMLHSVVSDLVSLDKKGLTTAYVAHDIFIDLLKRGPIVIRTSDEDFSDSSKSSSPFEIISVHIESSFIIANETSNDTKVETSTSVPPVVDSTTTVDASSNKLDENFETTTALPSAKKEEVLSNEITLKRPKRISVEDIVMEQEKPFINTVNKILEYNPYSFPSLIDFLKKPIDLIQNEIKGEWRVSKAKVVDGSNNITLFEQFFLSKDNSTIAKIVILKNNSDLARDQEPVNITTEATVVDSTTTVLPDETTTEAITTVEEATTLPAETTTAPIETTTADSSVPMVEKKKRDGISTTGEIITRNVKVSTTGEIL